MHDGILFAVVFAGNHDAEFVVDLEENNWDHQAAGEIESVILSEVRFCDIVRLPFGAGTIPARQAPMCSGAAAVTS